MSLISSINHPRGRRLLVFGSAVALVALISFGVMASQGWLPHTDAVTGEKTGWFGSKLPKNAGSTWNPFAAPLPTPTPQLSKEYIYAGSRLLAVEDANANAAPPADLAIWRPQYGIWYVQNSQGTQQQWGQSGDVPVPGDYDGDGKTDFTVFRPSTNVWWIWQTSVNAYTVVTLGTTDDVPAQADYDGDGKTDCAVFRPSNGTWHIYQSSNLTTTTKTLGTSGDKVAPADYDGDGKADAAIWRYSSTNSQFIVLKSSNNQTQTVNLGSASTDQPVSADYDGDGKADYALLGGNVWTILKSSTNTTTTTTWQAAGDLPVQNDYDGDGKVDIASYHPGTGRINSVWYIKNSHDNSTRTETWGRSGDIPVPAFYKR